MSLAGLGRQAVASDPVVEPITKAVINDDDERRMANAEVKTKVEKAQQDIIGGLTPWIPGDFVVTYGALLTAWAGMHGSFEWMLLVSGLAALVYVPLGAFAATGFKKLTSQQAKVLLRRTGVGFLVSVYAGVAIPNSGWRDFKWFTDHELEVTITAGILVVVPIMFLTGLEKRGTLPARET